MSTARLTVVHAKYTLLETARVPIAIIGGLVFPALSLLFVVVPQRAVADDPVFASQAVISLVVFALLANSLFGFGLNISEAREKPRGPVPARASRPRAVAGARPGVLDRAARARLDPSGDRDRGASYRGDGGPLAQSRGAGGARRRLAAVYVPRHCDRLLDAVEGRHRGRSGGDVWACVWRGLFLPPFLFADWLNALSQFLPSRQAREFVIWAVQSGEPEPWVWVGILLWTAGSLALALVLFRRDGGRRYR